MEERKVKQKSGQVDRTIQDHPRPQKRRILQQQHQITAHRGQAQRDDQDPSGEEEGAIQVAEVGGLTVHYAE